MEILFVIDYLVLKTGGPRFLISVFDILSKNGYRIHIITGYVEDDIYKYYKNFDIHDLGVYNYECAPLLSTQPVNVIKFLLNAQRAVNRLSKILNIDLIHLNSHIPVLLSYSCAFTMSTPIVCSIHHLENINQFTTLVGRMGKVMFQDMFEINAPCAAIHVPSEYVKEEIKKHRISRQPPIVVIPPGIEVENYFRLSRKIEEGLFVMIGRLEKRKHYEHAITAFRTVVKYKPNYKLIIIGEGPLRHELIRLIKRYNLETNVFLLGSVDEKTKLDLLSKAEALIHLGYPEGLGISVLEALAAGVPIIAYDVLPLNELVKHGITGVLVRKDDIMRLAKEIARFDRHFFNQEILRAAVKNYDINIIAKKFVMLYDMLACYRKIGR
ncbi:hypothetical protein DRH29_03365 [candidate division Kazan bacterium]|uniref:Glycosyltransferase family 1 protein n=1 Tax=candidate division Kazan bacterium TaxID=2202143 RepID=A0A420ZCH6_UNCK3|nr:MAG: hypothetical protein DRH29_03365 [candidate division Kazan bacterium]